MTIARAALPTQLAFELSGHQGPIRAVRFNHNGNYCITCGSDKTIKLWNPHRGLLIKTYKGPGGEVFDADAAPDNSRVVCAGADKIVLMLDVGTGQPIRRLRGHTSRINAVKFNSDASVIVTGSYDSTVRVWDCKARAFDPVQVLSEAKDSITSLQLSSNEIITGSVDGKIRRYDIRFGKLVCDTIGSPVTSVSFSRDGHCILVSSLDEKVRLLDKDNGELLNEYKGHRNNEYKVDSCLSHDDAYVVCGAEDGKIWFWDLVESSRTFSVEHNKLGAQNKECVVYSLSYHPKEPCLLSAGSWGPVKVWKSSSWTPEED